MKFHALAICVAGTLAAGIPASADHKANHSGHKSCADCASVTYGPDYRYLRDSYTFDMQFYPDLPSERYIADKLTEIVQNQRMEAAHLRALAPQAQTAGFENIQSVYNVMANDHTRLADFASNWLREHGFPVPAAPTAENISMAPAASVDHMIEMHRDMINKSLAARQGEKSATVRTMLLWSAVGASRHLDWLTRLDRDVDAGRTALSTGLRSMIDDTFMASDRTALLNRIVEEEIALYRTETTTVAQENPTYTLQYPEVVETIVERPVIVERVVERPSVAQTPSTFTPAPVRSQVAGERETLRRVRRPAK